MGTGVALQVVDDALRPYNVGQALLLLFVLVVVAVVPLRSRKVLSINVGLFGLLFLVLPSSMAPLEFRLFGLALVVAGPVLYVTGRR